MFGRGRMQYAPPFRYEKGQCSGAGVCNTPHHFDTKKANVRARAVREPPLQRVDSSRFPFFNRVAPILLPLPLPFGFVHYKRSVGEHYPLHQKKPSQGEFCCVVVCLVVVAVFLAFFQKAKGKVHACFAPVVFAPR